MLSTCGSLLISGSSVSQLCPTLCDPVDCSTPGLPVHHQLLGFTQTHIHWVGDAIQPSHALSSPSPPTFNLCPCCIAKWISYMYTYIPSVFGFPSYLGNYRGWSRIPSRKILLKLKSGYSPTCLKYFTLKKRKKS